MIRGAARIADRAVRRWQAEPELLTRALIVIGTGMVLAGLIAWQDRTGTSRDIALAGFTAGAAAGVVLTATLLIAMHARRRRRHGR